MALKTTSYKHKTFLQYMGVFCKIERILNLNLSNLKGNGNVATVASQQEQSSVGRTVAFNNAQFDLCGLRRRGPLAFEVCISQRMQPLNWYTAIIHALLGNQTYDLAIAPCSTVKVQKHYLKGKIYTATKH